jgi:hypothetical protein
MVVGIDICHCAIEPQQCGMVKSVALPTEGSPCDRIEAGSNPTLAVASMPQRRTE